MKYFILFLFRMKVGWNWWRHFLILFDRLNSCGFWGFGLGSCGCWGCGLGSCGCWGCGLCSCGCLGCGLGSCGCLGCGLGNCGCWGCGLGSCGCWGWQSVFTYLFTIHSMYNHFDGLVYFNDMLKHTTCSCDEYFTFIISNWGIISLGIQLQPIKTRRFTPDIFLMMV